MTRAHLCTLGEAMIRLSPPDGSRIATSVKFDASVGGAELNVAIASAALGMPATWLSSLPENPLAERIMSAARGAGVTVMVAPSESRVGLYFVEVGEEPRGVSVIYDRAESAMSLLDGLNEGMRAVVSGATVLYSSGITLGLGAGSVNLLREFYEGGANSLKYFEVNYRSKLWSETEAREATMRLMDLFDVLVASDHDLTDLLGIDSDPIVAARMLIALHGHQFVLIPRRWGRVGEIGSNTLTVVTDVDEFTAECSGRVVDPVGAGDAGTGAFIAIYSSMNDIRMAAEASVRASAFQQTLAGDASAFTMEEITNPSERRIRR